MTSRNLLIRYTACGVCAAGVLFVGTSAHAGIDTGLYRLNNHPDGNERPPRYGLRLDELFDVTDGHDVFTFDFDADGAEMFLEYDGTSIRIFGTAFGGLDRGDSYDPFNSSFVEVDFLYRVVQTAGDDDDLIVLPSDDPNSGILRWLDTGEEIPLFDYPGEHDFTFRFGNEDDDRGHRGFNGLSGWGWLNHHTPNRHIASSDWIFTATLVPAPGAMALLAAAGVIGSRGRRRK